MNSQCEMPCDEALTPHSHCADCQNHTPETPDLITKNVLFFTTAFDKLT